MMATFGERLRLLRLNDNKTLDELKDIFSTTKATLSRYENDKVPPKSDFINAAADYFNVSTDYIMGKSDIRTKDSNNENKYKYVIEKAKNSGITPERLDKLIDFLNNDK